MVRLRIYVDASRIRWRLAPRFIGKRSVFPPERSCVYARCIARPWQRSRGWRMGRIRRLLIITAIKQPKRGGPPSGSPRARRSCTDAEMKLRRPYDTTTTTTTTTLLAASPSPPLSRGFFPAFTARWRRNPALNATAAHCFWNGAPPRTNRLHAM